MGYAFRSRYEVQAPSPPPPLPPLSLIYQRRAHPADNPPPSPPVPPQRSPRRWPCCSLSPGSLRRAPALVALAASRFPRLLPMSVRT
jgi:hypothetical protein